MEVTCPRHLPIKRHFGRQVSDTPPDFGAGCAAIKTVNQPASTRRSDEVQQDSDGGRLASPVWPEKAVDLAVGDRQFERLERDDGPEVLRQGLSTNRVGQRQLSNVRQGR